MSPSVAHPNKPSIPLMFAALILAVLLAALDQTIVSTALPIIVRDFGGLAHLSWIVTSYLLTTTIVGPLYGKLGDLFGRKIILQIAIVIFLVGSLLCGFSQNLPELIIARAIQGLGGGGLVGSAIATVGDFVAPRDRGKYQGTFGAVFALATVLGPLIGGFFVSHFTWRWIFFVNIPFGFISLAVISAVFPTVAIHGRPKPHIDLAGLFALSVVLTAIVLMTSLSGAGRLSDPSHILALPVIGFFFVFAFIWVEKHAREPLMPLSLFQDRIFVVSCLVGFIVGLAMFGSITLMPVYLQMVKGLGPTSAGLCLTPMMFGVVITSVASGRIIARTGRYRIYPIIGSAMMTVALFAISTLGIDTPIWITTAYMLLLGLGLGFVMQNLVMAVQNAAAYKHLGVATSGTILFRSIGGLVGVSMFGAILAFSLRSRLLESLPAQATALLEGDKTVLAALAPAQRLIYDAALTASLHPVYWAASAIAACGFGLTFALKEIPLRKTTAEGLTQILPIPREVSSLQELERIVMAMTSKENRWDIYDRVTAHAGVEIAPEELWLLARLMERETVHLTPDQLAQELKLEPSYLHLIAERLMHRHMAALGPEKHLHPTHKGKEVYARVVSAWNADLERLLAAWSPEQHPDVRAMLEKLAKSLAAAPPLKVTAGLALAH